MLRIITGIMLIDGTGAPPVPNAAVIIDDSRILAAGRSREVPWPDHTVETLDFSGKTLMPGLIDAHVHISASPAVGGGAFNPRGVSRSLAALRAAGFARQTLDAGFTTIRDVGTSNSLIFALRQAVAEGAVIGPRIVASGEVITSTCGHGTEYGVAMYIEADDADAIRRAVRAQIKAGADFIKMITTDTAAPQGRRYYAVEQMQAGVDEAHSIGYLVAAHANASNEGIRRAVMAGVDTIEHGFPAENATLDMMAARGTILVPTLAVLKQMLNVDVRDSAFTPQAHQRLGQMYEQTRDTVRRANQLGVKIALGTDAGSPLTWHGDGALELMLMVECGLSPMEAILAGTKHAAQACGRGDTLGTIEAGKLADMIVVDGNPLDDISILRDKQRIKRVFQDGEIVVNRDVVAGAGVA